MITMKKLLPILLLLAALPVAALAQEDEPEGEDQTNLDSLEAALNAQGLGPAAPAPAPAIDTTLAPWQQWWQRGLRYQRQDSLDQALACADSVVEQLRPQDLRLPVIASYWLYQSRRTLRAGDAPLAVRYASLAVAADPVSLPAMLGEFKAATRTKGLRRALGDLLVQMGAAFQDFGSQLKLGSQGLVWASLALLLWGLVFALYLAVAYLPRLAHWLAELLPKPLPAYSRMLLAGSLLVGLAVIAAWVSLALAVLLLAIAGAAYASTKERVFLIVSVALVLAGSVGLSLGHHLFSWVGDEYLEVLNRANYSPYSRELYDTLAAFQQRDSSDLRPPFAMALLEKRAGDYARATTILTALSATAPNAGAANNLGNIYFIQHSYDTAAAYYQQAIEWDPGLAIAHYNLALVHLARLDFAQAKQEQERALALSLNEIEARAGRYGSGVAMDRLITNRQLWDVVMQEWNPAAGFDRREMISLTGLPLWLPPLLALGLLAALVAWLLLFKRRLAVENCVTCGAVICGSCHTATVAGEKLCRACTAKIGLAASPDLQQSLAARLASTKHYRAMLESGLANLLVPGSVLLASGATVGAWLLALAWAALLTALFANNIGLSAGQVLTALAGSGAIWWLAGAGALCWAVSWLNYLVHISAHGEAGAALPRTQPAADAADEPPQGGDHAA